MAEGVRAEYAEEVYRITPTRSGKGISLLCPMRKIKTRGDTLNLGTLSVVCREYHKFLAETQICANFRRLGHRSSY